MGTAAHTQTYAYARASALTSAGVLDLQTSGGVSQRPDSSVPGCATGLEATAATQPPIRPRFFSGFLAEAEPAAAALIGLANVAGAHYYRKAPPWARDPVVTCDGERLRFESFSACCGVYARLDVLPASIDGRLLARGTTNVDVNNPLRLALGRVRGADPLRLEVGPEELEVTTFDGTVVERKVPLPGRWLRGFAEVQALTSGFEPRARLAAVDAARFLRGLPRSGGSALWAVPAGRTLRLTSRPVPGAVSVPEPARLAELAALLRFGGALTVYGPTLGPALGSTLGPAIESMLVTAPGTAPGTALGPTRGSALAAGTQPVSSCWQLDLPGMRMTLTLSPQAARGFSGEGAVLEALAGEQAADDARTIGALLDFQGRILPDELAEQSGLSPERVRAALSMLGCSGRVGFDPAEAAYFHRELPFDASRAMKDNPRLTAALLLCDAGAVAADGANFRVRSGEGSHLVRLADSAGRARAQAPEVATETAPEADTCTCAWWASYRGGRGPCKHILAAQLHSRTPADKEQD